MRSVRARRRTATAGFTLLEALIAVALMGIIMGALATVTAQWLPNWSRGLLRVQRNEQLAIAFDRLVLDLGAAENVSATASGPPFFEGDESSVSFVRTTLGPNDRLGLQYVRYAETVNGAGRALSRARAPFAPLAAGSRIAFADPVVLLQAPYRIVFAYAGLDGIWKNVWQGSTLPRTIRLSVLDSTNQRLLPISTAVHPHINLHAPRPEQTETPPPAPATEARAKR